MGPGIAGRGRTLPGLRSHNFLRSADQALTVYQRELHPVLKRVLRQALFKRLGETTVRDENYLGDVLQRRAKEGAAEVVTIHVTATLLDLDPERKHDAQVGAVRGYVRGEGAAGSGLPANMTVASPSRAPSEPTSPPDCFSVLRTSSPKRL
jgi:hypothetical protein